MQPDPVATGARFRQRDLPADDAAAFVRERIAAIPTRYRVVVDVAAPADVVRRTVWNWGGVEPLAAASSRLSMNVDSFEWPAVVLASIGADFEVVSPPELIAYFRDVGQRFLRST
ncbi:WYL domain-containing protein [Jiangella asiatica]|uniref:WYL domain-containing protein n=1 Tax=Jiangella asiatica TaxID=2530372 RepID=UPI00193D5E4D|nr:WYL domain-containing protein [Jiangella asiatica]